MNVLERIMQIKEKPVKHFCLSWLFCLAPSNFPVYHLTPLATLVIPTLLLAPLFILFLPHDFFYFSVNMSKVR